MNRRITILNPGSSSAQPERTPNAIPTPSISLTGKLVKTGEAVFELLPIGLSDDPIDHALLAIKHHDFLGEIQSSPVLGPLVSRYLRNWQGIVSIRTETNKVLLHIQESLLPDRLNRAGFDPGYVKILLFVQDKYGIYKENSPN